MRHEFVWLIITIIPFIFIDSYELIEYTINSGGDSQRETSKYKIGFSVGEKVTGMKQSNNGIIYLGFWHPEGTIQQSIRNEFIFEKNREYYLSLYQNSPNPFKERTVISFFIPNDCQVKLELLDINGRVVQVIVNEYRKRGKHTQELRDNPLIPSGVLFCRLNTGGKVFTKKIMHIK